MSMVINTNVQATRTHGVYNRNNTAMNEAMTRVATAQKINSAKDGASVYAISERMRGQIRANDQANQNTQNDSALLKTAQGGISNTISILNTLRERAINSANDSNLNTNRSDIATEVYQLVSQIDDNANKVKFNGRTLLNGAVDGTVGKLNETGAVADSKASTSANPTTYSSHAVYSLTGLKSVTAAGAVGTAGSSAKLVSLVESNSSSAGDTILNDGDKITFSWKENGATVKKEITVTTATTLASLGEELTTGSLKASWYATSATVMTSGDTNGDAGTNDAEKNIVLDASSFDKLTPSKEGLYVIGNKDVAITDFAVSVTHKGTNGENINSAAAQETLALTGVQQSFGKSTTGSNVVLSSWLTTDTTQGVVGAGEDTKLSALMIKGSSDPAITSATTKVGITINGGTEFQVNTDTTIKELNEELKKQGYNVQAVLLNKGDNVTYNGLNVTRGTGEDETALKATASGLFFVGAEGDKTLDSIQFKTYDKDGAVLNGGIAAKGFKNAASTDGTYEFNKVQSVSTDTASGSKALTFFVGGEPNFGIDVTINKMTSGALLKSDASDFAEKFLTKEGAQSALTVIDNALNKALNEQTKLGALEARLGYTSDNLTTMNENLEASDSVMRDADLAKEMTNYMKYSVLSQAAQYMLAQSGQNAFSVLNLLQQ